MRQKPSLTIILTNPLNGFRKNFKPRGKDNTPRQKNYLMFEIRFSELAVSEIKKFIQMYEEGFFVLYKDSGIWAEDTILYNYRQAAQRLSDKFFLEIESRLKGKKVLGRKQTNRWQELFFYIDERLVIVYFFDDKENEVRLVESVGIDRKPIIF